MQSWTRSISVRPLWETSPELDPRRAAELMCSAHVLNTHVQVFISGVVAGCWEKPGDMIRESVGT